MQLSAALQGTEQQAAETFPDCTVKNSVKPTIASCIHVAVFMQFSASSRCDYHLQVTVTGPFGSLNALESEKMRLRRRKTGMGSCTLWHMSIPQVGAGGQRTVTLRYTLASPLLCCLSYLVLKTGKLVIIILLII